MSGCSFEVWGLGHWITTTWTVENGDRESLGEKKMSSILGMLSLGPEGFTGIHGFKVRVMKISYWNSWENCRWEQE